MKLNLNLAAFVSALALCTNAHADLLPYSFSGPEQITFSLTSNAVPTSYEHFDPYVNNFNIDHVSGSMLVDGVVTQAYFDLRFYSAFNYGGMDIVESSTGDVGYFTTGPQPYQGTVMAPTLMAGNFQLVDFLGETTYTLNVSAVPEPTTMTLMLAGVALVGGAAGRRRKAMVVAGA